MANNQINELSVFVSGDGSSLTATASLGITPSSITLVSANIYPSGVDVTANISSVTQVGPNINIVFVSAFTGIVQVIINFLLTGITQPVSLGNFVGKTNVMKTGTLVTTAVTADQVVLTYTVTALKTFYLEYLSVLATQTVVPGNSNPVALGAASLESPAGTKLITSAFISPSLTPMVVHFSEPIPIPAGTVIRVVCTPAAATSFTWYANFGGYEK